MESDGAYSDALSHSFGLCEALTFWGHPEAIPAELGFVPSPMGCVLDREPDSYPDCLYAENIGDGSLTIAEASRALRLLGRYMGLLRTLRIGGFERGGAWEE